MYLQTISKYTYRFTTTRCNDKTRYTELRREPNTPHHLLDRLIRCEEQRGYKTEITFIHAT